jgi:hypothetical protein
MGRKKPLIIDRKENKMEAVNEVDTFDLKDEIRTKNNQPIRVWFMSHRVFIELRDARVLGIPLAQYPWLLGATADQMNDYQIKPEQYMIYWDDLDEAIDVLWELLGRPNPAKPVEQ